VWRVMRKDVISYKQRNVRRIFNRNTKFFLYPRRQNSCWKNMLLYTTRIAVLSAGVRRSVCDVEEPPPSCFELRLRGDIPPNIHGLAWHNATLTTVITFLTLNSNFFNFKYLCKALHRQTGCVLKLYMSSYHNMHSLYWMRR
jgi:hypothetical protein